MVRHHKAGIRRIMLATDGIGSLSCGVKVFGRWLCEMTPTPPATLLWKLVKSASRPPACSRCLRRRCPGLPLRNIASARHGGVSAVYRRRRLGNTAPRQGPRGERRFASGEESQGGRTVLAADESTANPEGVTLHVTQELLEGGWRGGRRARPGGRGRRCAANWL